MFTSDTRPESMPRAENHSPQPDLWGSIPINCNLQEAVRAGGQGDG